MAIQQTVFDLERVDPSTVYNRAVERIMDSDQYAYVEITNSEGSIEFIPLTVGDDYTVISSYEVYTGINYQFEYLTITMETLTLESRAPDLYNSETGKLNIVAGKSRVIFHGRTGGIYTVTKVTSSSKKFTLTAYTQFETIRSKIYTGTDLEGITILDAFKLLLADAGIDTSTIAGNVYDGSGQVDLSKVDNNGNTDQITIKKDTYVWRLLQICAIHMGWKIWFTGSHMYVMNYPASYTSDSDIVRLDNSFDNHSTYAVTDSHGVVIIPEVRLHSKTAVNGDEVWLNCTSTLDMPSDSAESQRDTVSITYGSNGESVSWCANDDEAPTDDATSLTISEIQSNDVATDFCKGAVKYTSKPSTVVSFTVNEGIKAPVDTELPNGDVIKTYSLGTERNLCDPVRVRHICSDSSEIEFWNDGDPLKLILTSVKMTYPGRLTTYTFGENKVISLDTALSVIRSAK